MNWADATSRQKRERIGELISQGYSYGTIGAELGLCKSTVAYHARRVGIPVRESFSRRYDWEEVQRAIDRGATRLDCMGRFGFASCTWYQAIEAGRIEAGDGRIPIDALLVVGRRTCRKHLKNRLFDADLRKPECERCGLTEWRGERLALQLHHINGRGDDNRLDNLEILCPNCHAQTENWGGRNKRESSRAAA